MGKSRARHKAQPVTAVSLSSWAGSSRRQALETVTRVIGQSSTARIQIVPPREKSENGNQLRQTPVSPRKCNQQLVTRKGGKARSIMATAKNSLRHRLGSPASHNAALKPKTTARTVLR